MAEHPQESSIGTPMASHDKLHPYPEADGSASMPPAVVIDSSTSAVNTPRDQSRTAVSRYLKDKEEQWNKVADRNRPLTLLELPVDILRLIVKEITHTNDLTSLALTNSTLHNLAVPHIYARFDIVWPDGHVVVNDSKSVDALTYGLSTLCLGTSFARTTRRLRNPNAPPLAKFKGNEYAKYTRKFSLGNGPSDWVAEYLITKEPGKMLGTLVALAVAKMQSLETFTWDMPTGVLSDIFMSLASLPEYYDNNNCKLEKVWIRWHDNNENAATATPPSTVLAPAATSASVPSGSTLTPIGILLPDSTPHTIRRGPISYADHHVEYPTFSVLPPLKSLTVLEIDELAYLDEMSDLIARSADRLQELRVGISAKVMHKDFAQSWDGSAMQQVDHNARWPGESTIGERRLGGVLGVLVGKIYDIRRRSPPTKSKEKLPTPTDPPDTLPTSNIATSVCRLMSIPNSRKRLDGRLTLQTLELERVALSLHVCRYAIDWTVLTSITILDCPQHDALWKMLKKQYQPAPITSGWGVKQTTSNPPLQYQLPLKRIHTDGVTASLISFIKDTLAPNSLEDLFLQDRRRGVVPVHSPVVTIEQIFKGAIKPHRSSLRKLLIDSSLRANISGAISNEHPSNRWKCWVLPTEVVAYITSGRMSNLRELAVALDYKDWHAFLQRLPNLPQLRSLNIPNIANHVQQPIDPKELAMQIADVITLRPEIQLCYVGIYTKCFEFLETRDDKSTGSGGNSMSGGNEGATNGTSVHGNDATDASTGSTADGDGTVDLTTSEDDDDDDDDDGGDGEEVTDDDDEGDNDGAASSGPTDPDETQSEGFGGDDSDDDSFVEDPAFRTKLRLREILFYDDKVAIFKARHGKL